MIAFISDYPFHLHLFKNIYRHLGEAAEFVLSESLFVPEDKKKEKRQWMVELADELRLPWRLFSGGRHNAEDFFSKYQVLVAPWWRGAITLPCNRDKIKICVAYGYGRDLHHFGIWRRHFDLILTKGKYSNDFLRLYAQSEIVGAPQYDDWFSGIFDEARFSSIKQHLDVSKKTILYLPTHDLLSSVEFITPHLKPLISQYNLIIKPHHITIWEDKITMEKLRSAETKGAIVLDDKYCDLSLLFRLADVVLGDNSGSIFEAILVNKPVVLVDILPVGFFRNITPETELQMKTFEGSLEQKIKHEMNIGPIVKTAKSLLPAIRESIIEDKRKFQSNRDSLRRLLFSYFDGKGGSCAGWQGSGIPY